MTNQLRTQIEALNHASLPQPLPPVRLDVGSSSSWDDVRSGLEALGFEVYFTGEQSLPGEVVLVAHGSFPATEWHTAFLVIARERSLQAAETAAISGASGYFVAPFDFPTLGVAIRAAATQASTVVDLTGRVAKLSASLENDQVVSTVVGILMERFRLQRAEAYSRLRLYSRTERRKIVELSNELMATTEELGRTMRAINSRPEDG